MLLDKLPKQERPRERLLEKGAEALSLPELIAIILGKGTLGKSAVDVASMLLDRYGTLSKLLKATPSQLSLIPGIGPVKAVTLKALFEISRRLAAEKEESNDSVSSYADIARLIHGKITSIEQEQLFVVCLTTKGKVSSVREIGKGTLSEVLIHPREVFRVAFEENASQIIIAHTHPSGDSTPSHNDTVATTALKNAGMVLGMPLLEHIIVSKKEFSLLSEGILRCPLH